MNNPAAIYLQVSPADITFLCKILEGYEYFGVVTTLDRVKGLLAVRATPDTRDEVLAILGNLPIPLVLVDPNNI